MAGADDTSLERYELVDRIAVGGMAEVFRAKAFGAHGFEKTLAIKRILPDLARDPEFENRFISEAKLAVDLAHANVVQVLDFGRFGGTLFIAMEYVDGLDLAALLRAYKERGQRVAMAAALHIAIELCKGLEFAHQRGVVHRDVSPSNVLLSRAGEVKIADFGIAQAATERPAALSSKRRIMGKWRYMSPEQARGEPLNTRSDLFSAAIVLYELFTGEKLFPGDESDQILDNIQRMPIPRASSRRPELPARLDEVLVQALEREPDKRPKRAAELVRALTEISYDTSIVATALDVADAVTDVLGEARVPGRSGELAPPRAIDDLIRQQLGVAPEEATSRRTSPATSAALAAVSAPTDGEPGGDGDGAAGKTQATMVKRGVGEDGVTMWELEHATVAAVPSALRGERASAALGHRTAARARRLLWLAGGAAVLGLSGAGWALWGRSATQPAMALSTSDAAPAEDAAAAGRLSIDSEPTGAPVWVDGELLPEPTPTTVAVAPGRPHRIEIEATGYRRWRDDGITVRAGETFRVKPDLMALRARLKVTTVPDGASVSMDGQVLGVTPLDRDDLPPGLGRSLVIDKPGFKQVVVQVHLSEDRPAVVDEVLRSAVRWGHIKLHIDEGWAEVYLNGKKIGKAPTPDLRLPVGKHRLRLVNPVSGVEKYLDVDVPETGLPYYRTRL